MDFLGKLFIANCTTVDREDTCPLLAAGYESCSFGKYDFTP